MTGGDDPFPVGSGGRECPLLSNEAVYASERVLTMGAKPGLRGAAACGGCCSVLLMCPALTLLSLLPGLEAVGGWFVYVCECIVFWGWGGRGYTHMYCFLKKTKRGGKAQHSTA